VKKFNKQNTYGRIQDARWAQGVEQGTNLELSKACSVLRAVSDVPSRMCSLADCLDFCFFARSWPVSVRRMTLYGKCTTTSILER